MTRPTSSLFGTDGIRGRVGELPITLDFFRTLARTVGSCCIPETNPFVVIGRDTRESGTALESALVTGFVEAGVDVGVLGVAPTPTIAFHTRNRKAAAGVVVSASHNPYTDNGVKFFDSNGFKWSNELQARLECELGGERTFRPTQKIGNLKELWHVDEDYVEFCCEGFDGSGLQGLKMVVDCAHGAAWYVAPTVFRRLGAEVIELGTKPDGKNINANCGSTQLDGLQREVVSTSADIGIAFDGDADRVQMVDGHGNVVDGDQLLFAIALRYQKDGTLRGGVVGSEMSNFGLQQAFAERSIPFHRASVGDSFVHREMVARNWCLGGETSGHIICRDKTTTGDGIVASLEVLTSVLEADVSLAALVADMPRYPQKLVNVRVDDAHEVVQSSVVQHEIRSFKANGCERALIRPSGTEPVVRIMVEGRESAAVDREIARLTNVVQSVVHDSI